jgi:hypothetical protein
MCSVVAKYLRTHWGQLIIQSISLLAVSWEKVVLKRYMIMRHIYNCEINFHFRSAPYWSTGHRSDYRHHASCVVRLMFPTDRRPLQRVMHCDKFNRFDINVKVAHISGYLKCL